MKKQVVKTMSIGLSALTLASSMSVTAFADETQDIKTTIEPAATETAETAQIVAPMNDDSEVADNKNDVKDDDQKALDLLAENAAAEQAKAQAEAAKGGNVTVPEAQNQVTVAEEAVKNTEIIKNQAEIDVQNAQAAYDAAQAAVKAAEDKLTEIEKECFGEDGIKDDAKAAYDAANAIVNQAQGTLIDAEDKLDVAKRKQNDAYFAYETAKTVAYYAGQALNYANANVDAKETAKDRADDNYTKAENAANKAAADVNAITEIIGEDRETLKDAVKAVNDCANIISEKDAEIIRLNGERQQQVNKQKEAAKLLKDAEDAYEDALKKYGPKNAEVIKLKADAEKYANEVEVQKKIVSDCEALIKGLEEQKKPLEDELKSKTEEVDQLEKDLQQLYLDVLGYEKNEEKLAELNRLNDEVERTSGVVSTLNGEVTKAQGEIDAANTANPDHEQFTNYGTIVSNQKKKYNSWNDLDDNATIAEEVLIKNYYAKNRSDINVEKLHFERYIYSNDSFLHSSWHEKDYIMVMYNGLVIDYFNFEVLNANTERINNNVSQKNTDDIVLYRKNKFNSVFNDSTRVGSLKELESNIEAYGETTKAAQDKIDAANAKLPQANTDAQNATSEYNNYADKEGLKAITDVKKALEDAQKTLSDTRQLISDNSKTKSEKETLVMQLKDKVNGFIQQITDQTTAKNTASDKKDAADKLLQPILTTLSGYEKTVNEKNQAYTNAINEHGYNSEEAKTLRTEIGRIDTAIDDATKIRNKEAKKKQGLLWAALDAYDTLDWHENVVLPYLSWAQSVADNNLLEADREKQSKNFEYESAKAQAAFAAFAKTTADKAVTRTESALNEAKANKADAQTAYNTAKADHKAAVAKKNKVVDAIDAVMNLRTQAGIAKTAVDAMEASLDAIVASYNASVTALAQTQTNLTEAKRLQAERDAEYEAARRRAAYARAAAQAALEAEAEEVVIADAAVPTAAPTHARRAAVAAATVSIEDEQTPLAGDSAESVETEADKDEAATIADEKTPLATTEQNRVTPRTWWAWLVLAVAAIAAAVAYSKKKLEDKLSK